MTLNAFLQLASFLVVLLLLAKPLGAYMAQVFEGQATGLSPLLRPLERAIYRLGGVREQVEMDWRTYAMALLWFGGAGMLTVYGLQRLQGLLPLNPQGLGTVAPDLAFNTAASYVTNTNWQAYAGETTMSHLTQMLGLTVQNFVSAATGIALLLALTRGVARRGAVTIGNFWVDLVRCTLYVLLPLALLFSLLLVGQGAVQTLGGHETAFLVQSSHGEAADSRPAEQRIALGPAATQVISRDLGTSGGGFFNANGAHPFENPTPFSDFLLLLAQTLIAAALPYTFGTMVGDKRQGWAILAAMLLVLVVFVGVAYRAETAGASALARHGVALVENDRQPGGSMEGKEVRFGMVRSALTATVTTATSTGSPNAMHDSLSPLGGLVTLVMMQVGETVLGGVGTGLVGMLVIALIAVFIAGLMIGRTPEYLGKKLEPYDMKMAMLTVVIMPMTVLGFTAVAVVTDAAKASIFNPGSHGFSEVLYAFTSMTNNNGSTFGGLNANTAFFNVTGSVAMLIGRLGTALPVLALAGSLARKTMVHVSDGTLPTHTPLFVFWMIAVLIGIGVMTFFPALALGPIVEHMILTG